VLFARSLSRLLERSRKLGPALALIGLVAGCGDSRSAAPGAPPTAPPPQAAAATEHRVTLAHGRAVAPGQLALDRLQKVDLAQELSSGSLTVDANDPLFPPRFPVLVDGDVKSLARSENINPLILTLTFSEPKKLAAARMHPAGSPYDWLIEPTPGGDRLMVEGAPDSTWSQIDLPSPVETSVVRLEILRRERDDYVHVDEIELYSKP
jgi:hypothetical protein